MEPLLSIVIPTRNREIYCIEAIKAILDFKEECFELIVQDNSDSDEIERYVSTISDSRLVYQHIVGRINSVINMDSAISQAKGEYTIMIGDDDMILPNIFKVAAWMKEKNISALSTSWMPMFTWDDCNISNLQGTLQIFSSTNKIERVNTQSELLRFLKNGCVDYLNYKMPKAYHGIVLTNLLSEIKKNTNHIIGGLSPDLYLSVALSTLIKEHIYVDFPITINGICKKSTSYDGKYKLDIDKLENAPHLYKRGPYEWENNVPKIYTSLTIWADSAIHALREMHREDLCEKVNYQKLQTVFNMRYKSISSKYPEVFKSVSFTNSLSYLCEYLFFRIKRFTKSVIRKFSFQSDSFVDVNSWPDVLNIYQKHLLYPEK